MMNTIVYVNLVMSKIHASIVDVDHYISIFKRIFSLKSTSDYDIYLKGVLTSKAGRKLIIYQFMKLNEKFTLKIFFFTLKKNQSMK